MNWQDNVVMFYDDQPSLFIIRNGLLVMSSGYFDACLMYGGIEMLALVISKELSHLSKQHLLKNLSSMIKFGDLKAQLFMFNN